MLLEQRLKEAKEELQTITGTLEKDNFIESKTRIMGLLRKIEKTNKMTDALSESKQSIIEFANLLDLNNIEEVTEEMIQILQSLKTSKMKFDEEWERDLDEEPYDIADIEYYKNKTFTFERHIRGGVVKGLPEGDYNVPEKMVRDMGVEQGDKLTVVSCKQTGDNGMKYWFEIKEKISDIVPNRMEFKRCLVEKTNNECLVRYSEFEIPIKVNDEEIAFILHDNDTKYFCLNDRDIVDIALDTTNPLETVKVLHKYTTTELNINRDLTLTI